MLFALPSTAETKTMVALYKVQLGKMPECVAALHKTVVPELDRRVADVTIQSYGVDVDVLHSPGQPNVAAWFAAPNYSGIQRADEAVLAAVASHPQEAKTLLDGADMNAHQDLLLEPAVAKFGKVPDGAKPFVALSYLRVKSGKEADFNKAGTKYYSAVYEQLVNDGVIYGYQVLTQAFHGEDSGGMWIVVTLPEMAALDKVDAAFQSKIKSMTPTERSIMENSGRSFTEESAHRDYLMRSIAFRMAH